MSGLLPALLFFTAITGMWQAERRGEELELRLLQDGEGRAVQEFTVPIAMLSGIEGRQIDSGRPAPVSFHFRSEAGTFGFHGSFARSSGAGLYSFSPRPAFVQDLLVFLRAMLGWGQVFDIRFRYRR